MGYHPRKHGREDLHRQGAGQQGALRWHESRRIYCGNVHAPPENFASEALSGDFTIISRITSLSQIGVSSNTYPTNDMLVKDARGDFITFSVYRSPNNGTPYYTVFGKMKIKSSQFVSISGGIGAQQIPSFPFWRKLTRVAGVYTPYTSQDGINWTAVTAGFGFSAVYDPSQVGIAAYTLNQDISGVASEAILDNISVNGVIPSFTDADSGQVANPGDAERQGLVTLHN